MESRTLFYLRNNRWTLHLPVSAGFFGGGLVSLWWLYYVVLLHRSPFRRPPGVFRAQDWGQLRAYASPKENEAVSLFQRASKPSSWFFLSPPFQVELPAHLHPPDLVYTSSGELIEQVLPIALATRIFAKHIGHSTLLKIHFLRLLLSPKFDFLPVSVILCTKEPREKITTVVMGFVGAYS